jgi:protein-disulfide isomerase
MTDTVESSPSRPVEAYPPAPAYDALAPQPAPRAWLTLTIQSGSTVAVGLLMLLVGMAAGYLLRPLLPLPAGTAALPAAPGDTGSAAAQPAATVTGGPFVAAEATQAAAQAAALMEAVVGQTRHFRGSDTAPVTIIEFSDFQCPYCGRFATETFPGIDEEYIRTGQVRVGYQHFAFLGEESRWAAEASECANEQGAFWEYHDLLFSSQSGENQGAFNQANLKQFAQGLGLDAEAFATCLDSGRYASLVTSQTQAAQQLGVRSTPTFLVNGRPVLGAQPFDVFSEYIDAALNP